MPEPSLKKLNQQEVSKLKVLIQEVQQIKKTKQDSKLNKSSSSGQPNLKQLQADRYLRMCYLMLRHGLYGVENKKMQTHKDLYDYLCFYQNTYQLDDSKFSNTNKLHIFEAIKQSQLKGYINRLVIMKIQALAKNVHELFQAFFKQIQMVDFKLTKTLQIAKNLYQDPLEKIIITIETNYVWDRWKIKTKSCQKLLGLQFSQKQCSNLNGLNAQTLCIIVELISQLKKLSTTKHFRKKFVSILQQFRQKKFQLSAQLKKEQIQRDLYQNKQKKPQNQIKTQKQKKSQNQIKTQKQKQKQEKERKTKQVLKLARVSTYKQILKQKLFSQSKIDILLEKKETQRRTRKMQIVNERSIEQATLLQTLRQLSLLVQREKALQNSKQAIQQGVQQLKLIQSINEFNYGMMEKRQIKKLGFKGLMKQVKTRQIKEYMRKKERNNYYLYDFEQVYEKHCGDDGSRD